MKGQKMSIKKVNKKQNVSRETINKKANKPESISPELMEMLKKQGVNVEELNVREKGTRANTMAKIESWRKQDPKSVEIWEQIQELYGKLRGKKFTHDGKEYGPLCTTKVTGK